MKSKSEVLKELRTILRQSRKNPSFFSSTSKSTVKKKLFEMFRSGINNKDHHENEILKTALFSYSELVNR